jgi:hypothetical protein
MIKEGTRVCPAITPLALETNGDEVPVFKIYRIFR